MLRLHGDVAFRDCLTGKDDAIGLVVGSAGAFVLKSLMQFIVYIIMFALLAYIFRGQIEALTGVNPVTALEITLGNFGLNVDLSPD